VLGDRHAQGVDGDQQVARTAKAPADLVDGWIQYEKNYLILDKIFARNHPMGKKNVICGFKARTAPFDSS
jgi:hypothetical protein